MSAKEQRMLQQALQISVVEQQNVTSQISEVVPQMPAFHPTEEEFTDPIGYIEKLVTGPEKIAQYGCVKIVPPASFKPPLAFDMASEQKLPTRFQILQELSMSKPFNQNNEGHTFR